MDKRYQVFVSSTFTDLVEERRAVMQALLEQDCIPAGMELFVASDQSSWELIEGVIDDCDYYVVIVGARYGSLTEEGVSFTEKEYDYAVSRRLPVLGFIHENPDKIEIGRGEKTDEGKKKLAAFVEKVRKKQVKTFASTGELAAVVGASIAREMKRAPGVGWVRGDQAMTPETAAEISELKAKVAELELSTARASSTPGGLSDAELDELEQGDDTVSLTVGFKPARVQNVSSYPLRGHTDVEVSWNSVVRHLGPVLLHEASEEEMVDRLGYAAAEAMNLNGGWPDEDDIVAGVEDVQLDQVKVQLRALGLIDKGTKRRAVSDKNTYWKLTDKGDLLLAQLMAIRRGVADIRV